jgi:hypothetical protein
MTGGRVGGLEDLDWADEPDVDFVLGRKSESDLVLDTAAAMNEEDSKLVVAEQRMKDDWRLQDIDPETEQWLADEEVEVVESTVVPVADRPVGRSRSFDDETGEVT